MNGEMSDFPKVLEHILGGDDLSASTMETLMQKIMQGELSHVQMAAFLIALEAKGINSTELGTAAKVMRSFATKVELPNNQDKLIDTCGSGGDGANTFNISTASSFVAVAAGCKIAKHGNKAVSSSSGSADILAAAGAKLELSPAQIAAAIEEVGFGFMFAPLHHSAMKNIVPVRQELKVRTMFNLLGPLTNPASCQRQLIGVFAKKYLSLYAKSLRLLGSTHVLVVHSQDGLDEISCAAPSYCAELKDNEITEYEIKPQDFGLQIHPIEEISCNSVEESLSLLKASLLGEKSAPTDIVALNAGAAIYIAGISPNLKDGVAMAQKTIASGAAMAKLEAYVAWTQK